MIKGGYYIKARQVQESEISHAPPHIREIWDWLLMKANHKDNKFMGIIIERGQLLTSYKEILDGLSWKVGYRKCKYSKSQCEIAMKFLRKGGMITTTKTTRGFLVNVINYTKYQEPKNYESHNKEDNEKDNDKTIAPHYKQEYKELKNEKKNLYSQNSNEFQLSELLLKEIKNNNPNYKTPDIQKWSEHIDKMIRIDKRPVEYIRAVILWSQQDDFWKANILSTQTLRKQFDKLLIKAKADIEKKKRNTFDL